jgi:hypothetical protein
MTPHQPAQPLRPITPAPRQTLTDLCTYAVSLILTAAGCFLLATAH